MRFRENKIVSHLLDECTRAKICDLNKLATMEFSRTDREQFAMLIGYSLTCFEELNYVSDETWRRAAKEEVGG